ncbi:MAG: TonB-dependent receptor [Vicinamibacterales bacterium]
MRHTSAPGRLSIAIAIVLGLGATTARAQTLGAQDLKRLSLEDLLRVEVSTAMRVPEPTTAVPAPVFVITQDDIRRSGATSLPEVLRLAPGVQVAQQDAARYAIGIRGFADRLSRSMLVLMDGRAVYSPLFAGTYWEVQDTLLEDIDRIEIVRGPGGTLWGANAVNGIINIITKKTTDTRGTLVSATLGSDSRGPVAVRYGNSVGSNGFFRVYAKAFEREPQFPADGDTYDQWHMTQGGFRSDWSLSHSRSLTVQGDLYTGALGQRVTLPLDRQPFAQTSDRDASLAGGNVLARWIVPSGQGEYQVQTYYDRTSRDERPVAETRDTIDLDFQHRHRLGRRHGIVWGGGYRVSSGRITAIEPTAFLPPDRTDNLVTTFVQDDVAVIAERLRLILGAKVEHNEYSGFEIQPSARLMWTARNSNTLFGGVTRAVRTPSRVETDYTTTSLASPAVPAFVRLVPNPDFQTEELTAYELGYRARPVAAVYVTVSGFFNRFEHTLSTELLTPFAETTPPPARLILPVIFRNGLHGHSHGVELTADTRPFAWWRVTTNYSFLNVQMTRNAGSADVSQERRYEGLSPRHQLQLASSLDLPRRVSVDWFLRYVSALPAGPVPSYTTSSVRLAWQLHPQIEVAVVGQNLHDARHLEWPTGAGSNVLIERDAHVTVTWRR